MGRSCGDPGARKPLGSVLVNTPLTGLWAFVGDEAYALSLRFIWLHHAIAIRLCRHDLLLLEGPLPRNVGSVAFVRIDLLDRLPQIRLRFEILTDQGQSKDEEPNAAN